MPKSYTPFSGAAPVTDEGDLNDRFQEKEDYFLGLLENGKDGQRWIEALSGEILADRDAAYLSLADNKIYKMDSDAAGPKAGHIRGFVAGGVASGVTAKLVIGGSLDGFTGLTAGGAAYVGTSAGAITQTKPVASLGGAQVMVAEMGLATTTTSIFVRPRKIAYMLRDAVAQNDILTVNHPSDEAGYVRETLVYGIEEEVGAVVVSYASSNQDSDVALSDRAVATYTADLCSGGTPIGNMTGGNNLAGSFDNNNATYSRSGSLPAQIGYDFGAANAKTIRQYTVRHNTTTGNTAAPEVWTFEWSDNNSAWTVADTVTGQTAWGSGELRTFQIDASGSHRYWRLNISDNNGAANTDVGELEMMEAATFTDGPTKLTQTFNLAGTETVGSVGLWLKKVGSPTGTATVRIETVSGGNPTGTLADAGATATFAESGLGTGYAETVVNFASSFSLASGDYALVLSTDRAASETNYIVWGADGSAPGYAGGEMKNYDGSWNAESKDAVFAVYGESTEHPNWIKADWWSSSFADVVRRYGDGSGADLSTKTAFKCLRAAGFDDLTVVVELN
jgi:hypothetical protein